MDRAQFWTLVEQTKDGDCQQHAERLTARLRQLGPTGILAFQAIWDQLMDESYRWDLWGAAYLANGGCSDDGFDYFRGWLIGQGRKVYETVLADPDSLAVHADGRDQRLGWGDLEVPVRLESRCGTGQLVRTGTSTISPRCANATRGCGQQFTSSMRTMREASLIGTPGYCGRALWRTFGPRRRRRGSRARVGC
jgi:hypothetical protein